MWWIPRSVLLFLVLHTVVLVHSINSWGDACPAGCICHTTTYVDLPMKRWLREGTMQVGTSETHNPNDINEVVYTDEISVNSEDINEQLLMATCIIQKESDVRPMFASLPEDVQVLTILQSRGSDDIYLEATHMQSLQLIALNIQGFHQDAHNNTPLPTSATRNEGKMGKIIIRSDTFQPLTSLQYLNLQHIKILGNLNLGNRPAPIIQIPESMKLFSNNIPIGTFSKGYHESQNNLHPNNIPSQIVILQPTATNNEEILPYKFYKEEQERAALSIFSTLNNLLFLRVYGCGLKEVNWEMFIGLQKLEYLSLEKNNLLFIPDFTFYGTTKLKTLSLAHNKLLSLHSTGLAGLLDLDNLDLSHNNFSHLSELSLPPFPKLQKADFRGNPIQEVFASTFEIMNATKSLFLGSKSSNFTIQTNSFLGLDCLVKLDVLNVNIPVLERDLLRGMPELQQLKIQGCVKSLSFDAFLDMPKLQNLVMKACNVESISMDAFYGLYGLIYLDLSHNLITSLPPGVFDQQFSLKELHLENNLLTELPLNIFGNIPAKVIRLTGNPWDCTCAMRDWKPAIINGRKQHARELCQFQYDKGSTCSQLTEKYVYDRTMAPRCATPTKYKNWSVFTALRKQLHCNAEKYAKFHRKEYLKKKHEEYKKSLKSEYLHYYINNSSTKAQVLQQNNTENAKILMQHTNTDSTLTLNSNTVISPHKHKLISVMNSEYNEPVQGTMAIDIKNKSTEQTSNEKVLNSESGTGIPSLVQQTTIPVLTNGTVNEQNASNVMMMQISSKQPPQPGYQSYEPNVQKAKLQKLHKLQAKYEQTKKKEKLKSGSTYVVYNNKKPIKVSKEAWQIELEKTRQAKLKLPHQKKS